jgi:hypothetical protein
MPKKKKNVILDIWEAEIWRIMFQGQPRQTVLKTPSPKYQK